MDNLENAYCALSENITANLPVGKSVAIYGVGDAAFHVNEILRKNYRIIGFLDRDPANIGCELFGGKVIALNDAVNADAIFIAANPMYWGVIFSRIQEFAECYNILVYNTDGKAARLPEVISREPNPYWNVSMTDLQKFVIDFEIISFDIFDTILTRKISEPKNLFDIITAQILRDKTERFASMRLHAEAKCRRRLELVYNISDIYNEMCLDSNTANELMSIEFATEARFITIRQEICDLIKRLIATGKRVILVSDMYLPHEWLSAQLNAHGIEYERLFISSEEGMTKESGLLWEKVLKYAGDEKICHIGDDVQADIETAKASGIPVFHCLSELEMLRSSTLSDLYSLANSPGDYIALGMIKDKLMNNPFSMYGSNGAPIISDFETFGYVFCGSLIQKFFSWFIEKVSTETTSISKIFFTARDGWFFNKVYSKIRESNSSLPESHYLPASRRLCTVASFFNEDDVFASLSTVFTGRLDDFFRMRLGINYDGKDKERIIHSDMPDIAELVKGFIDLILSNAATERERYVEYIRRLSPGEIYSSAIFDIGKNGTVQNSLEKIYNAKFVGLYVLLNDNSIYAHNRCSGLYQKTTGDGYTILENLMHFSDTMFTAPHGMCLYINENGVCVYDEMTSNNDIFYGIRRIHDGIIQFMNEYVSLANGSCLTPSKEFAAAAMNSVRYVKLHKLIKNVCIEKDRFVGRPFTPVFK